MRELLVFILVLFVAGCDPESSANDPGHGSTAGSGGAPAPVSGEGLPCDVDAALEAQCRQCHADPPRYGAPMPLETYEDMHAPAASDPSHRVFELMLARIHDDVAPMPPSGELSEAEAAALDAWLASGAPRSDEPSCSTGSGGPSDPPVGPEALPCEPSHTFLTHAPGTTDPFQVPEQGADNLYQCFTFKSPFNGTSQGTAWAPIVGDERVLHHWILFRTSTPQEEGGVIPCNMPADATFMAGWAPGGQNFVLPDDVGLELARPDEWLILQVHYHNTAQHADARDASGVALCTTDQPRQHTAGIYTLGTVGIDIPPHAAEHEEVGECGSFLTSFLPQPLTLIASFPHMHEHGRAFRTEILRGGDPTKVDTLVDVEHFTFDNQQFYPNDPPVTLNPGDAIRTTCVYDNTSNLPVYFGESTEEEMCFNFVMLYPITLFEGNRNCGLL
jgi:Copper type II ascorbate-dependent monooxygenase, C-terminal domain/Copper type II ascorbate-dependent monooxygenase, N-terminal domain